MNVKEIHEYMQHKLSNTPGKWKLDHEYYQATTATSMTKITPTIKAGLKKNHYVMIVYLLGDKMTEQGLSTVIKATQKIVVPRPREVAIMPPYSDWEKLGADNQNRWKVQTGACIAACVASHIDFVLINQPYQDENMAKKDKLALTKIWFNQLLLSLPKPNITKTIELAEGSGYHNNTENDTPDQEEITEANGSVILVQNVNAHGGHAQ